MKKLLPIALISLCTYSSAYAGDWKGQGEAGLTKASGNTDTENFNVGLGFVNKGDLWTHEIDLDYFKNSSDGVDSAESLAANYTAKRSLTERSYIFADINYLDDSFDGFTEQTSAALGYGYHVIATEQSTWEVGIGIGYRDTDELTRLDDGTELIGKDLSGETLVLLSNYQRKLTSNTQFLHDFRAEIGSDNSFIQNDASLVVAMNDKFALKAGLLTRHNTDPAPGADDTDTITSLSLLYNFGN